MTSPIPLSAPPTNRKQVYENIRSMLETERSSFITLWRNINDFIVPMRGRFQTTDSNRGDRRSKDIIDVTATLASRTLGAGMTSGITNPARPWVRLTTPDPDLAEHDTVKEWLQQVTNRMLWIISRSNFYNKCPTIYQDLGNFGTAAIIQLEDDIRVTRFVDVPVGSFAVGNGPDDLPEIFTRIFRMTARQMVREFGIDRVSQSVRTSWEGSRNTEAWYDVVHIILRNDQVAPLALHSSESKPWVSVYYEPASPIVADNPQFLRESGFDEMPVYVPVWETTGEDVYGTNSPGITALGDVRQLQTMERRALQGLEKMVNPPMTGPTALRNVRVSTLPSEITYVDTREGQQGFRAAHEVQLRLDQLEAKEQACRARIERTYYTDLFLMLSNLDTQREGIQPFTAAEVYERHEEKLLALGSVLQQLDLRLLDPMIKRLFNMMNRRGFIPPPPPDIHGMALKIEYTDMLHQAQKSSSLGGMQSLVQFALPLAKFDPSVLDKVNSDKMLEHFNEGAGNAPDCIVSQEKVDQIRAARAQAAQARAQAEQMQTHADTAKKLSQADMSGDNALTQMSQQQGGTSGPPTGQP